MVSFGKVRMPETFAWDDEKSANRIDASLLQAGDVAGAQRRPEGA